MCFFVNSFNNISWGGVSKNSCNFKVVMSGSDGCHHGNGKYLLVVIVRGLLCLVAYICN